MVVVTAWPNGRGERQSSLIATIWSLPTVHVVSAGLLLATAAGYATATRRRRSSA
jgi:hypothetical protein